MLRALTAIAHRYDGFRFATMAISLGVLVVIPLLGVARVDLWGGNHLLWFRPAELKPALGGVILGIAAFYVVTFLFNVVAGRMFCGWGCPIGQVSRFGEAAATVARKPRERLVAHLEGGVFSALLVLAVLAWWVDLAVLIHGSPRALVTAWGAVFVGVMALWAHGRWWRWDFCMKACPIGLYYSFVSPAKGFGIQFDSSGGCVECNACDNVCPVELMPRSLLRPIPARGGASIADAPGHNHCLECGDCVRACEMVIGRRGDGPAPLRLGFRTSSGGTAGVDGWQVDGRETHRS